MKWFKHISDSLDDPFIFGLINKFGGDGYLVFFGVLEIYSREFKPKLNWNLQITRAYLKQKLHKRQDTLIIKILKVIQNSGKWEITFKDDQVIIFIPKFIELIDNWTKTKLSGDSEETNEKLSNQAEAEAEVEADKDNNKVPQVSKAALPEIKDYTGKKIFLEIENVSKDLYEDKSFKDVFAFKNTACKRKINPKTILHTLLQCKKHKPKDPWAYCVKILKVEDGNYNANDFMRKTN